MCGIFGFISNSPSDLDKNRIEKPLRLLLKLSEPRGREAAGVAIAINQYLSIYKRPVKASQFVGKQELSRFLNKVFLAQPPKAPLVTFGHTRLVTSGSHILSQNNQPILCNRLVGVHNGVIANEKELGLAHPPPSSSFQDETDSGLLFRLIDQFYSDENDIFKALAKAYSKISGSASIAFMGQHHPFLLLATNTGSLYYAFIPERLFFVFGSERYILEQFFRKMKFSFSDSFPALERLEPNMGMSIHFETLKSDLFSLKENFVSSNKELFKKEPLKIADMSLPPISLKRCVLCILPETYPFISFDSKGVCNYCKTYRKQEFLGYEVLERVLEPYRSTDGRPDCIVGYSGGRDSSYGLHILKTKLGMHPIAYTYDWGLVTHHARKNQSRVVGKLGIEHIIRAADIRVKRRYIRKNIDAWLKKPELGMVPLFMAGDKLFYYYGRQLRQETGIKLTIFAAGHQLEQMEFKVGFCGIDQKLTNNTKLYHFKLMNKVQLALWYIKQYLLNPRYINESFFDSILAYYASFLNKDDYLYLYRYIPWDEKLMEKTLKEEYGWEEDGRYGKNQWRMGDGQTAFINYIYYTVAGFSEFDNFRSNQIREGLITRQEALELVKDDNRPRLEMLEEFSQMIGFNLEEVLLKINDIPKHY